MRSARFGSPHQFFLLLIALAGCSAISGPEDLHIRVRNVSSFDFENLIVQFPGQREGFGRVEAGAETAYRRVARAYRYAYVETVVAGDTLVLQPIDFVGERLLEPGRYTYELALTTVDGPLSLQLVEQ